MRPTCRGPLPDCAQGVCLDARSVTPVMPRGPQRISALPCWQQFCNVHCRPKLEGCWVIPAGLKGTRQLKGKVLYPANPLQTCIAAWQG